MYDIVLRKKKKTNHSIVSNFTARSLSFGF